MRQVDAPNRGGLLSCLHLQINITILMRPGGHAGQELALKCPCSVLFVRGHAHLLSMSLRCAVRLRGS